MSDCTPARVEERLRKAIALRTRLADNGPELQPGAKGIGTIGGIGVMPSETGGNDIVALATETLSWLQWLEPDDAGIVRTRLEGAPWKMICWRFGISRPTADRRWRYALALISWRLNGNARSRRTPSLRSMLGLRRAA